MALCVAKIGDYNHDKRLSYEGLRLYSRALFELQKALADPELIYHDHTLAACSLLSQFEISQCPQDSVRAYLQHMEGCEKLVQMRGPERHVEGLGHKLFLLFRVQAVCSERI